MTRVCRAIAWIGTNSWTQSLREEIEEAESMSCRCWAKSCLSRRKAWWILKPGDIIPCDFDGNVTLYAEGVPVLRGSYGASRGQQAVKVTHRVSRHKPPVLSNVVIGGKL